MDKTLSYREKISLTWLGIKYYFGIINFLATITVACTRFIINLPDAIVPDIEFKPITILCASIDDTEFTKQFKIILRQIYDEDIGSFGGIQLDKITQYITHGKLYVNYLLEGKLYRQSADINEQTNIEF